MDPADHNLTRSGGDSSQPSHSDCTASLHSQGKRGGHGRCGPGCGSFHDEVSTIRNKTDTTRENATNAVHSQDALTQLDAVLRSVSIDTHSELQDGGAEDFTCRTWVRDALIALPAKKHISLDVRWAEEGIWRWQYLESTLVTAAKEEEERRHLKQGRERLLMRGLNSDPKQATD